MRAFMVRPPKQVHVAWAAPFVLLLLLGFAGCSSDSPNNPTDPGPGVGNVPGAQIDGQVTSGGAAGMSVSVRGTGLQTVLNAQGAFSFQDVPPGDQVLLFATAAGDAALGIPGVRSNEHIEVRLSLQGANANLETIEREVTDGDDESEDDGEGNGPQVDVFLQVSPDTWNTNWVHSSGTVQVFLRGPDFRLIDLDSIELHGDDPDAEPVLPVNTRAVGNHVLARFAKSEAFESLLDPQPGDVVEITVIFTAEVDGEEVEEERMAEVRIVGPGDDEGEDGEDGEDDGEGELTLQVSPSNWNTNWPKSSGTVQVFFRGSGFKDIDLDSIELIGDDPDAEPLAPRSTRLAGNHVQARFGKADAFATLDEPESGDVREITLRFTVDGEEQELTHEVRIVGP